MSEFEEKYIYPLIKNKSIKYLRYIDDIFMAWIQKWTETIYKRNKSKTSVNQI